MIIPSHFKYDAITYNFVSIHQIGKIVKLLGRKGQLDRTWLVVTSDHGYHLGQFTLPVDKRLPYETDVRVPLLVIAPGNQTLNKNSNNKKDNTEIDSLAVVSIDLAPTILDMAALPVPYDMDGLSLLPLILSRHPPSAEVKPFPTTRHHSKTVRKLVRPINFQPHPDDSPSSYITLACVPT